MTTFSKIIFWLSIGWIIICVFALTVGQYLPFEFHNEKSSRGFYILVCLTFPLSVLLTARRANSNKNQTVKVVAIVFSILSFLFLSILVFGKTMCGYTTDEIVFVNKSDSSSKIIKKHYGCGAWDSDLPKYEFYETKVFTRQMSYSKRVDTLLIDKNLWIRKSNKW